MGTLKDKTLHNMMYVSSPEAHIFFSTSSLVAIPQSVHHDFKNTTDSGLQLVHRTESILAELICTCGSFLSMCAMKMGQQQHSKNA